MERHGRFLPLLRGRLGGGHVPHAAAERDVADPHPTLSLRRERALTAAVKFLLLGLIRAYQLCVSPFSPPACRFTPTCSQYAVEAISRHGACTGGWLAVKRLARCHPWGGMGDDPVP